MNSFKKDFKLLARTSPFTDMIGPIYQKKGKTGLVVGLLVEDKHCNARGTVHGGIYGTLADIAMGYSVAFSTNPPTPVVTVSQTIDYVGKAQVGDWLEVHTDIQKVGRRLSFANCYFVVNEQRIARSSGVFSVTDG
ncbi:PaaI family thioesterase [Oceaniserpentilla sp. 4NH20-0058]|uniref:PaaI family thioesterase n=1 Tax=Oceaniserpentilla sp. 4NH20-0058 TaxID=3127660 RepID=UPI003105D88B